MTRRIGPLEAASGLRPGDHACWAYSTPEEHQRVLTEYLREGLAAGERVAYLSYDGSESSVRRYLEEAGEELDTLIEQGRFLFMRAQDAYTPNGTFDPDERITSYRASVEQAIAEGFTGFRVAAEAAWLLREPDVVRLWPGYELRADILATEVPFVALCCYDTRIAGQGAMALMASVHAASLNVEWKDATFHIHASPDGALRLAGDVDFASADLVRHIGAAAAPQVRLPAIDVSDLRFADVNGVRAIRGVARSLGGTVELKGASRLFRKIWSAFPSDLQATFD